MGPSTFNFAEAAGLSLLAGASMRARDMEHAVTMALKLVEKAEQLRVMAQAARVFAASNRGAAERTATALLAIADGGASH
jgi:3-deoxy-D-manno-octulosonic-acid transferase